MTRKKVDSQNREKQKFSDRTISHEVRTMMREATCSETGIQFLALATGVGKSYHAGETMCWLYQQEKSRTSAYITPQKKNLDEEEKIIQSYWEQHPVFKRPTILRLRNQRENWSHAIESPDIRTGLKKVQDSLKPKSKKKFTDSWNKFQRDYTNSELDTKEYTKTLNRIIRKWFYSKYPDLQQRKEALQESEHWLVELFPEICVDHADIVLATDRKLLYPFCDFVHQGVQYFYHRESFVKGRVFFLDEICSIKQSLRKALTEDNPYLDILYELNLVYNFQDSTKNEIIPDFSKRFLQKTKQLVCQYHLENYTLFYREQEKATFPTLFYDGTKVYVTAEKETWYVYPKEDRNFLLTEDELQQQKIAKKDCYLLSDLAESLTRWKNAFYAQLQSMAYTYQASKEPFSSLESPESLEETLYIILRRLRFEEEGKQIQGIVQNISQGRHFKAKKKSTPNLSESEDVSTDQDSSEQEDESLSPFYSHGFTEVSFQKEENSKEYKIQYMEVPITPEAIVFSLAQKGLVVALSADAESPSILYNLSLSCLQESSAYIPPNPKIQACQQKVEQLSEEMTKKIKVETGVLTTQTLSQVNCIEPILIQTDTGEQRSIFSPTIASQVFSVLQSAFSGYLLKSVIKLMGCFALFLEDDQKDSFLVYSMSNLIGTLQDIKLQEREALLSAFACITLSSISLPKSWEDQYPDKEEQLQEIKLLLSSTDTEDISWISQIPYISFSQGTGEDGSAYRKIESYRDKMARQGRRLFSIDCIQTSGVGYNPTRFCKPQQFKELVLCRELRQKSKKDYDGIYVMGISFQIAGVGDNGYEERIYELLELHEAQELSDEELNSYISNTLTSKIPKNPKHTRSYHIYTLNVINQCVGRINRTEWKNRSIACYLDDTNLPYLSGLDYNKIYHTSHYGWLMTRVLQNLEHYFALEHLPEQMTSEQEAQYHKMEGVRAQTSRFILWKNEDLRIGFDQDDMYSLEERKQAWTHREQTWYGDLMLIAGDVNSYEELIDRGSKQGFTQEQIQEVWNYCIVEKNIDQIFRYSAEYKNGELKVLPYHPNRVLTQRIDSNSIGLSTVIQNIELRQWIIEQGWFDQRGGMVRHGMCRYTQNPAANQQVQGVFAERVIQHCLEQMGWHFLPQTDPTTYEMVDLMADNGIGIDVKNWLDPVIHGKRRPDKNRGWTHFTPEDWRQNERKAKKARVHILIYINLYSETKSCAKLLKETSSCQYYVVPSLLTGQGQLREDAKQLLQLLKEGENSL